MNHEDQLKRAENDYQFSGYAKSVIDNPAYKHALMVLKADNLDKFQRTTFQQKDEREELWRRMKTIADLEVTLEKLMQTGRLAEQKINKLEKLIKQTFK